MQVGAVALVILTAGCGSPAVKTKASSTRDALTVADLMNGGNEQDQRRHFRRFQDIMTACMKKDGWTYTPIDADTVFLGPEQFNADQPALRAKFGFGISIAIAPDAPPVDVNTAYMEALGENEAHLYIHSENVCNDEVTKERGDPPMQNPAIAAVVDRFFAELVNDPRVQAAQTKWSACMREHGYTYKDEGAITSDLMDRMASRPPAPLLSLGKPPPPGFDPVELKTLQELELAIAKADSECNSTYLAKLTHDINVKQAAELLKQFPELAPK